jgi:hypothetical protein
MNLFYLDYDIELNAQYHVNAHVIKMILEGSQLLHTQFHLQGIDAPYKPTHRNHPTSIWVRESMDNFQWTINYVLALAKEYLYRYNKVHACMSPKVMGVVLQNAHRLTFPKTGLTPFTLAMPDQYKTSDPVGSYRRYYNAEKRHLFTWKNRDVPNWID